jgi:hypothetical protein
MSVYPENMVIVWGEFHMEKNPGWIFTIPTRIDDQCFRLCFSGSRHLNVGAPRMPSLQADRELTWVKEENMAQFIL